MILLSAQNLVRITFLLDQERIVEFERDECLFIFELPKLFTSDEIPCHS